MNGSIEPGNTQQAAAPHQIEDGVEGNFAAGAMIQSSLREIQQAATYENLKTKLELLCSQVEETLAKLPEGKQKEVAQHLCGLVTEALKEAPALHSYELGVGRFVSAVKGHVELSPAMGTLRDVLAFLRADHGKH